MKHIVIIGGGPAGISMAQTAAKKCNLSPSEAKITILEKQNYQFHTYGALRGMIDKKYFPKLCIPYKDAFRGRGFSNDIVDLKLNATVTSISYESKTVTFEQQAQAAGPGQQENNNNNNNNNHDANNNIVSATISYDYLVIATGSSYSSQPMKPSGNSSEEELKQSFSLMSDKIKNSDRILVIGGGAVGIEMVGELKSYYPNKKIMLLDSNRELLSNQNVPKLREPAKQALLKMGVELYLGHRLETTSPNRLTTHEFGYKSLTTNAGLTIESDARLVCVGMKPNVDLMKKDHPECMDKDGRFIKVKATMQVDHHPSTNTSMYEHVFVLGDASNHQTPKMGYWAGMQGAHLAQSIAENIRHNKPFQPYEGPSVETLLVSMGPDGGVAQLPLCGAIIMGNFFTKIKSRDLMAGMSWKNLNATMPN